MRKIILASHGKLAAGMKNTIEMLAGKNDNLLAYCGYVDGNDDINEYLRPIIEDNDEVIIITDLLGGSINKEAVKYLSEPNVYVVCGMNVALILNIVLSTEDNVECLIQRSISESCTMTMMMKLETDVADEEF